MQSRKSKFGNREKINKITTKTILLSSYAGLLMSPLLTLAQDSIVLEEILVTAQKREQNIQDVGISVTTLSGNQVDSFGYTSTADIVGQIPGMQMLAFSPSLTVFNIRGVSQNDFADHFEPPVAVFSDEAYISSQGAVNTLMYDIERIEVLRGPQGTLFGRNATGGTVHYISRKPTEEADGYARVTFGEYNKLNIEGAVSGPLSDKILVRASGIYARNDGWLKNRIGPDLNANDDIAGRLQFLIKVSDDTDIALKFHITDNSDTSGGYSHQALFADADGLGNVVPADTNFYGTCNGCDLLGYSNIGNDTRDQAHDREGFLDRTIYGMTGKITSAFSEMDFVSITDYLHMDKLFASDSDASPNDLLRFDTDQQLRQFSQELRLSGDAEKIKWVVGLYYLNIDTTNMAAAGIGTLFNPAFVSTAQYDLKTESGAVFGQIEYNLSSQLSLTAGVRYTTDTKSMNYALTNNFGGLVEFNEQLNPDLAKQTYNNVSAKIQIDYRPSEDVLLYAGINRGTKAGSFSAPIFEPFSIENLPHDQEVLTSYEAGVKLTGMDGRMRLNSSAFYYDYNDYQAFFLQSLSQQISNRNATVYGAEVELAMNPTTGLDISVGISLLDGTVDDVTLPAGRITDRELPMTPDFSANWLVRYSIPAFGGTIALQTDGRYTGTYNFYVVNPPSTQEPSHTIMNARISYLSGDEKWEFAVDAKNFTNESYRLYTNDISALSIGLDGFAPPRWISVSLTYRLN